MSKTSISSMLALIVMQSLGVHTISDPRYCYDVPLVPDIDIVSLETMLDETKSHIRYQEHTPPQEVCYQPLPFAVKEFEPYQPYHVTLDSTWVLKIPHGRAFSLAGYVLIDEKYLLRELLCHCGWFPHQLNLLNYQKTMFAKVRKVSGRVAVITRLGSENYSHFLFDVLGRLAMLELMGIEYDWLYMPYNQPHIRQILEAWGIDPLRIIQPFHEFQGIEADELIVPSHVGRLKPTPGVPFTNLIDLCAQYLPAWLLQYYRERLLPLVNQPTRHHDSCAKRIFISRKDSSSRRLLNEDEVFEEFKKLGFKKYILSSLTFVEQIELFHNAEIVVGAHGAGLSNIVFCNPGTKLIELFQERSDCALAFLAQTLGLDYTPVKTVDFLINDRASCRATVAPIEIIQRVIQELQLD